MLLEPPSPLPRTGLSSVSRDDGASVYLPPQGGFFKNNDKKTMRGDMLYVPLWERTLKEISSRAYPNFLSLQRTQVYTTVDG
jgi:hypothetical protein